MDEGNERSEAKKRREEEKRGRSGVSEREGGEETILVRLVRESREARKRPVLWIVEARDREYSHSFNHSFAGDCWLAAQLPVGQAGVKILRGWAWRIICFALLCFTLVLDTDAGY